jgi:phosphatidylserine/phosphatidylglycerophosphate/cardiolipin synthase-like enzyme
VRLGARLRSRTACARSDSFRALVVAGLLAACAPDPGTAGDEEGPVPGGKADAIHAAPGWLLSPIASGTWTDPADDPAFEVVHAWVDLRVANRRFDKRVFVEIAAPYGPGRTIRTLHAASYRSPLGGGKERWGTDRIEIYPKGGPHGASLSGPVLYRLRMQEDPDGDGRDQMLVTAWTQLHGEGTPAPPTPDPFAPGWSSPVRPGSDPAPPRAFFTPFDDAGKTVIAEIDRVVAAKQADPAGRHTLHAAIFNINDPRIVDRLLAAHAAGVELRLITDATKLRPSATWQTEDDRLIAAGVPLLGVRCPSERGAMHDKIALFDGARVATGSFNWEWGSSKENHENMILAEEPELVAAYAERLAAVAGEVQLPRTGAQDLAAKASVSFAPDEEPYRITGKLLDGARQTIHLAIFTCKNVEYEEGGKPTSLFAKLVAAVARGVKVTLITDHGIAEAAEYFGVWSEDDQADEWLEDRGVHVVRADNPFGKYASMHHKFMVVDGAVLATGAFNWYHDAAYLNDEDQLVLRDPAIVADFEGELVDLLRRYDPAFDPTSSEWPKVELEIRAKHPATKPGDSAALVGDLPALGAWIPSKGVLLDPSSWPIWTATVSLPAGVRAEHKLVTLHPSGGVSWSPGANRRFRVPTAVTTAILETSF